MGNKYSPTVSALPITSKKLTKDLPIHTIIRVGEVRGLDKDSVVLAESGWTLNKTQLTRKIGEANDEVLDRVADCLLIQMPLIKRRMQRQQMREVMYA